MLENAILALTTLAVLAVIGFRIYKWLERGGLYYMAHPVAKSMDDAKRDGKPTTEAEALKMAGKK